MTTLWTPVDFENNKLYDHEKGFDLLASWGGTIEVAGAAAKQGSYGCKFTPASSQTVQHACGAKLVRHVPRIRQAVYIHPNAISMPSSSYIRIARNYHSDETNQHYNLCLYYDATTHYCIQANMGDNSGTIAYGSSYFPLDQQNDWNLLEWDWYIGSPGQLRLWINGSLVWTRTATNYQNIVNYPSIGTCRASSVTFSGSYYLDYWRANDDGTLIGA